ncbi:ABC transporter substrate-binding protein [Crassaminicella profunda]|nr:ABC transporter substrate-binding protein [Crassaminicella profunda]
MKFGKKLTLMMVFMLMVSLVVAGCGQKPAETSNEQAENSPTEAETSQEDVIKIGVFEPLTGANAAGGAIELEGVELANELYPEVLGKKVELVIVDNKSDKVEAANATARLIEKEKVSAIIGSWGSSFSMAAGDAVRNSQIPAIGASCTNPLVTLNNDYYFRACFIDPFQGAVMANYAFNKLGAKKAAIIQEVSSDYSVGLAKFFTDAFKKITDDESAIVGSASYNTGDQDFTAQLTNIKQLKPDVIFAPGNFTESALLIKQAKQLGMDIPILGGDTWETQELIDIGGEDIEGTVMSTFFTSEKPITEMSKVFLDKYREKYNKEPASCTALGFDAYIMVIDAIKRAESSDPKAIRDALAETKDFEGAAGIITLDENGDAVKSAVIKVVKDGKFTYLDTVEPMK